MPAAQHVNPYRLVSDKAHRLPTRE
jgi:hypothetical protein